LLCIGVKLGIFEKEKGLEVFQGKCCGERPSVEIRERKKLHSKELHNFYSA